MIIYQLSSRPIYPVLSPSILLHIILIPDHLFILHAMVLFFQAVTVRYHKTHSKTSVNSSDTKNILSVAFL